MKKEVHPLVKASTGDERCIEKLLSVFSLGTIFLAERLPSPIGRLKDFPFCFAEALVGVTAVLRGGAFAGVAVTFLFLLISGAFAALTLCFPPFLTFSSIIFDFSPAFRFLLTFELSFTGEVGSSDRGGDVGLRELVFLTANPKGFPLRIGPDRPGSAHVLGIALAPAKKSSPLCSTLATTDSLSSDKGLVLFEFRNNKGLSAGRLRLPSLSDRGGSPRKQHGHTGGKGR